MSLLASKKETRVLHASKDVQGMLLRHPISSGFAVFFLGCTHNELGDSTARPSGSFETLLIVTVSGRGCFKVGKSSGVVRKGDILLVPPSIPHAYWCDSNDWSYYWAHLVGTDLPMYMLQAGGEVPVLKVEGGRLQAIATEFESAINKVTNNRSLDHMILASHSVRNILAMALFPSPIKAASMTRAVTHQALEKSLQFLLENTRRALSLKEVADEVGLSPSRLANLFKSQTGTSPMAHHMHLRVQEAAGLLASTGLTVKEVAARMGFHDPYYFSRAFKSHLQISPSGYRQRFAEQSAE